MINPIGLTVTQWCDAVILAAGDAWSFGRLDDEARWQDWAVAFLSAPSFAGQTAPDPYDFTDWRDWAMRVNALFER